MIRNFFADLYFFSMMPRFLFILYPILIYIFIFFSLFFRQSPEQDFAGLPDPFGSYRAKLSYKDFGPPTTLDSQISDRSQSLDHIQDPKMLSYTQREINR